MIKEWLGDLAKLLFPKLCFLCKQELVSGEHHICSTCITELPQTNFHLNTEHALSYKLKGRFDFEKVMALYYFNTEGKIQEILHEIKYNSNEYLAKFMGQLLAHKLGKYLKDIDIIIPVPLHPERIKERGYNQSDLLAQGVASILNIPIDCGVVGRVKNTESQTHKTRSARIDNMKDAFIWKSSIQGKHILLIDDVITTGSTLESLVLAMPHEWDNKFSILSLAAAIES